MAAYYVRIIILFCLLLEYLNNKGATRSTIDKDGWLHTGDIVYFDQEGFLYVVDRLKDIIKYNGFQVMKQIMTFIPLSCP